MAIRGGPHLSRAANVQGKDSALPGLRVTLPPPSRTIRLSVFTTVAVVVIVMADNFASVCARRSTVLRRHVIWCDISSI